MCLCIYVLHPTIDNWVIKFGTVYKILFNGKSANLFSLREKWYWLANGHSIIIVTVNYKI